MTKQFIISDKDNWIHVFDLGLGNSIISTLSNPLFSLFHLSLPSPSVLYPFLTWPNIVLHSFLSFIALNNTCSFPFFSCLRCALWVLLSPKLLSCYQQLLLSSYSLWNVLICCMLCLCYSQCLSIKSHLWCFKPFPHLWRDCAAFTATYMARYYSFFEPTQLTRCGFLKNDENNFQ